jgi:predicted DNA-binding protein (MmcQ/YjbR family)
MNSQKTVRRKLREFGLAYPEAHSKSPWPGHDDLAVRNKTFAYLSAEGEPLSISCKLPLTGQMALTLSFAKPTGYGLGKSGWVTATFGPKEAPPLDLLKDWIDESYRVQAPKKLVATLPDDPRRPAAGTGRRRARG